MKKEIAEIWVKALRSGQYGQTQKRLKATDDSGYCCLGVLCTLAPPSEGQFIGSVFHSIIDNPEYDDEYGDCDGENMPTIKNAEELECPLNIMEWAGLKDSCGSFFGLSKEDALHGKSLAELNDTGKTFAEIADLIEANYERL